MTFDNLPMNGNLKFAFLVIAKDSPKYNFLKTAQKITWVRDFKNVAPVYYVYGNGKFGKGSSEILSSKLQPFKSPNFKAIESLETIKQDGFNLFCDSVDGWEELLPNTLSALSYLQENYDYDFVVRTNLSTYWNPSQTIQLLKSYTGQDVFAGPIIRHSDFPLIPGYAMVLSRTAIAKLLANLNLLESSVIDDVAISRAFHAISQPVIDIRIPWVTIKNYLILLKPKKYRDTTRANGIMRYEDLDTVPAVRCREDRSLGSLKLRMDVLHFLFIKFRMSMINLLK